MDFTDNELLTDLHDGVARVVGRYGHDYYIDRVRTGRPCDDVWRDLGANGFLGVNIPEEHGGAGAGMVELATVCEATATAGVPLLLLVVSAAISAEILTAFGSEEQRRRWLPSLADGSEKVVFAITEPDAGSNSHRIATTARRDGDEWVLSGQKYFISGVDEASAILVVAKTAEAPDGKSLLSMFLVPPDAPGLERHHLRVDAMLPEKQFTLFFDDVRIPADALVGTEGRGFAQVFHGLNPERIAGAALCVGIARHAIERAVAYARDRRVWDVAIGSHQGLSHPLAKAHIETELAALMVRRAAWLHDRGEPAGAAANMAKYAAAEAALAAIDAAVQTHGGNGVAAEFGLLPYWGFARVLRIAPVSREMILNYIAQHELGLPRSY